MRSCARLCERGREPRDKTSRDPDTQKTKQARLCAVQEKTIVISHFLTIQQWFELCGSSVLPISSRRRLPSVGGGNVGSRRRGVALKTRSLSKQTHKQHTEREAQRFLTHITRRGGGGTRGTTLGRERKREKWYSVIIGLKKRAAAQGARARVGRRKHANTRRARARAHAMAAS